MNKKEFLELKELHWVETRFLSSMPMTEHLQEIIDAGEEVLPFIFEDWENSTDMETFHWFLALLKITGVNPVPSEDSGRILAMRDRWIEWYAGQN